MDRLIIISFGYDRIDEAILNQAQFDVTHAAAIAIVVVERELKSVMRRVYV